VEAVYKTANKRINREYDKPRQDWEYKKIAENIILDFPLA